VLRLFVRRELFDENQAAGMLAWPHSGFHVHTAVWVPEDDRAFAKHLARYCARNPVALERLTYDRAAKAVMYRSDKSERPTAGTETADPLVCPHCAGAMRIVAFITQSAAIDQILMHLRMHLRTRADSGIRLGARSPPSTAACLGLPRPHETNFSDAMKHFFRWIRFRRAVRLS
jgi:hypothetical protein